MVRVVRDVGPQKDMLCATFRLPHAAGLVEKIRLNAAAGKRGRIDEGGAADEAELLNGPKRSKET